MKRKIDMGKEKGQLGFEWLEDEGKEKSSRIAYETRYGKVVRVAVNCPLDKTYSYFVPNEFEEIVKKGSIVEVPLGAGNRKYRGICIDVSEEKWESTLKPILNVLSEGPIVDDNLIELGKWISEYYVAPIGMVFDAMIPSAVKEGGKKRTRAKPYVVEREIIEPNFELNDDQRKAIDRIKWIIREGKFKPILVHGVTASGKTEIYIRLIREVIAGGGGVIFLVPEIALTTQMIYRLAERLGRVAILHSGLSESCRRATWNAIREGKVQVVVGTRSSVFAPVPNLKLIVIDEEQEPSFKNIQSPRYHTREVAIKRAEFENIPIVLGSATPALETYYNARNNPRWEYLWLPNRIAGLPLPKVVLIDMIEESRKRKGVHLISMFLEEKIHQMLISGKQVMLLLNRRGHSSYVFCPSCKFTLTCPNCKSRLVYHKSIDKAICHHCSVRVSVPERCDRCGHKISKFGLGTQRVEEEILKKFPGVRLARMDADTMRNPRKYEEVLSGFAGGEIDILLGTQMIAKGLDFPNVGLVGVLCADLVLSLPDFRAGERTFQLLAQVAGRAGRADYAGLVIVQSYNLSDRSIQSALNHDYHKFAKDEMYIRKKLGQPPFASMCRIVIQHRKITEVQKIGKLIAGGLQRHSRKFGGHLSFIGPVPAVLTRLRGRYRYQIIIKAENAERMREFFAQVRCDEEINLFRKEVVIDIDPVDLL